MAMKLWWRAGWGSALIEAQLAEYGLQPELVALDDPETGAQAQAEWAQLNPMQQLPVLQMDDGRVLTESAAITLLLADHCASELLVPAPGAPEHADFLRWLIWLVSSVYPCATFYQHAAELVADPIEARGLQTHLIERMEALWLQAEAEAGAPWFLGERFSALDLFLAVMLRWGDGLNWVAEHAPRLYRIAAAASARPAVAPVIARNFPDEPGGGP